MRIHLQNIIMAVVGQRLLNLRSFQTRQIMATILIISMKGILFVIPRMLLPLQLYARHKKSLRHHKFVRFKAIGSYGVLMSVGSVPGQMSRVIMKTLICQHLEFLLMILILMNKMIMGKNLSLEFQYVSMG